MNGLRKEMFRKFLHILAVSFYSWYFYAVDDWKYSVLAMLVVAAIFYPILKLLSLIPGLTEFIYARKKGEFSRSFLEISFSYCIVAAVCWGIFNDRNLGVAAFMAWGPGDAAAALIGKAFGKHKIGKDKKKSIEGTVSMFFFSFISVFTVLVLLSGWSLGMSFLTALVTAVVSAIIELYTPNGSDTFFCPISATIVLLFFKVLFL